MQILKKLFGFNKDKATRSVNVSPEPKKVGLLKVMLDTILPQKRDHIDIKPVYVPIPEVNRVTRRGMVRSSRIGIHVRIGDKEFTKRLVTATPCRMKECEDALYPYIAAIDFSQTPTDEVKQNISTKVAEVIADMAISPKSVTAVCNSLINRVVKAQLCAKLEANAV